MRDWHIPGRSGDGTQIFCNRKINFYSVIFSFLTHIVLIQAELNGEAESGGLCWNVRVSDSSKDGETVKFTVITKTVRTDFDLVKVTLNGR